ncbi:YoaK family protein [Streptomyces sp. NPDC048564]|uniref:YoaK family protein n=1 Tax=Streptomyces sp. NPDC048564 TaxID=3155760 RepID=UPI003439F078
MSAPARSDPLPRMLIALTAVTGIVDAVAFLGLGQVFTAFMTGNILFLGFAVAGGVGLTPLGSLTALAGFAAGAVAGSRLGAVTAARLRRWLLTSAAIASALLVAAALAAIGLDSVRGDLAPRHYAVIALTALAMGVRSATMWRLGAGLNTTLVTGTLVTLVRHSELGGASCWGGGGATRHGTPDTSQPYRAAALVAVFAGAAVGTLLLRAGLTVALLVAAAGVLGGIGGCVAHPASGRAHNA